MRDIKILVAIIYLDHWLVEDLGRKLHSLGLPQAAIANTMHNINQAIKAGAINKVINGHLFISTRTLSTHFAVSDDPRVDTKDHEEVSHRGFTKHYVNVNTFPEAIARANLLGLVTYAYERQ